MSNVYVHSDYAVVGVMHTSNTRGDFHGSQVFVRKLPFEDHSTFCLSFCSPCGTPWPATIEDYDIQERFEANVVPLITSRLNTATTVDVQYLTMNSNLSSDSYVNSYQKTDQSTNPRIESSFAPWFV